MSRCLKIYLKTQILNKRIYKKFKQKESKFHKNSKREQSPQKTSFTHKFLRKLRFDFGNPRVNARLSLVFLVVIIKRKPYKLVV